MEEAKLKYLKDLATALAEFDIRITRRQLAEGLNINGFKTNWNKGYELFGPGPGLHKLLSAAYNHFYDNDDKETAKNIAERFLNNDYDDPWNRR